MTIETKAAKRPFAAIFSTCAAIAVTIGAAPASANPASLEAESIRKLNIMLMVTSLRCRTGVHDFQAEYRRFSATHLSNLNAAGKTMRGAMHARYGVRGSKRALDKVSVQMANAYGDGHPWMDCEQLKKVTHDLSLNGDRTRLSAAARELLSATPAPGSFLVSSEAAAHAPAQPPTILTAQLLTNEPNLPLGE